MTSSFDSQFFAEYRARAPTVFEWVEIVDGLRPVARRFTRNTADAEDLLSELWFSLGKFDPSLGAHPRSFAYRCLENLCRNRVKANTNRWKYYDAFARELVGEPRTPEELVLAQEAVRIRATLVNRLSDEDRTVLMACAEGLSHREIGDLVEISEGTSRKRVSRLRKVLIAQEGNVYGKV